MPQRFLFVRLSLLGFILLGGSLFAALNHLQDLRVQALHAPDDGGDSEDAFGHAVAIDGEWAVVGAPRDDSAEWADEGSAYVMRYQAGAWQIHQKLMLDWTADTLRYYTTFAIQMGQTVAISGDWLAVGVPGYYFYTGSSIPRTGRVLLFRREGLTWVQAQVLDAPSGFGDLRFGEGLALKEDRLVVGAPGRTIESTASAKVCLYRLSTAPVATWSLTDTLNGPEAYNSGFGKSVAVYRNGVVIGLPGMTHFGMTSIAEVRWYRRLPPYPHMTYQTIVNPDPAQIARFGSSLSVSGDRLLVGCRGNTTVDQVMGCLLKKRSAAELLELESKILAPTGFERSNADCPVALSAERGFLACVQSLPIAAKLALTSFPITDLMPAVVTATDVSVSGTRLQADDQPQVIATTEDHTLLGSSFEFSNTTGGVWPLAHPSSVDAPVASAFVSPPLTHLKANDGFGEVITADADTIIASATRWRNRGSVHVFTRERGIWKLSHSLDNPNTTTNAAEPYGAKIAVSGGWMAVNLDGAVLLYPFREGRWQQTPVVIPQQASFPILQSIDISGDVLITVASDPATPRWIANRYQLTSTGPVQRSTSFLQIGSVPLISRMNVKGQVAMLVDSASSSLVKIFDTSTSPWTPEIVPLSGGRQATSIPHSRSLTWDGDDLIFHDANQQSWPIILTKKTNAWTVKDPFIWRGYKPNAFALSGDRALLVTSDRMDLYQRQKTGWLPARELTPPFEQPIYQDHRSGTFIYDSIIHGSRHSLKGAVFVHLIYDMEVYDGTLTYSHLALTSYTPKDIGIITLGQDTPLPLTLKNTGDTPWTFAGLEATPQIITLPASFRPKPVPPGGTLLLPAILRPTSAGSQKVVVAFRIAESQLPLNLTSLTLNAQTELPLPLASTMVSNEFAALGEPFTLSVSSTISRSQRCRWLKNGRPIASESSTALHRPKAAVADAGSYAVEVTAADGTKRIIQSYRLCVYEQRGQTLRPRLGSTLTLDARAWGPGVRIGWDLGPDDARIRGHLTPRLQILDWHPSVLAGQTITASAFMAGSYREIGRWTVENPPFADLVSHGPLELVQGEEIYYGLSPIGLANYYFSAASISATGLPPGVTLDTTTNYLTGIPTVPGIYMVTYKISFAGGQAPDVVERIIVHPAGKSTTRSGTQTGVIWAGYPVENGQGTQEETLSPGMMTLEVTTSGKVSAQWLLAGRKLSAIGQYQEVSDDPMDGRTCQLDFPAIPGFPPLRCRIVEGIHSSQIDCIQEVLGTDGQTLPITGRLDYPVPVTSSNLRYYAGRKTAFMSATMEDTIAPGGTGFASLSVSKTLHATAVGTLPDGTALTLGGRILDRGMAVLFCRSESADSYFTGSLLCDARDNHTYWRRPPTPGSRLYPAGFKAAFYYFSTYTYHPPASGMLLFPSPYSNNGRLDLTLLSSALTSEIHRLGQFTTAHTVKFDPPNLNQAKISFYTPTGFFTGSAVVNDLLPGSETRRLKRTVNFRGMLTSGGGEGFFLLPMLPDATAEPPTTTANSPILSGVVRISPAAE